MWHVVDDITVSEEDDGAVGGEEDEDVPDPVEVGEADPGPVGAEEAVVDPGGERHADDGDTALPQVHHPPVALLDRGNIILIKRCFASNNWNYLFRQYLHRGYY